MRDTVRNPEGRRGYAEDTEGEGVDVGAPLGPQEVHEDEAGEHGKANGDVWKFLHGSCTVLHLPSLVCL